MFRSEDMSLVLFFINRDQAKHCISYIGHSSIIHFIDLNKKIKPEKLPFTNQIKHMEKLRSKVKLLVNDLLNGEVDMESRTNKSFLMVEEEINRHFERYMRLKDIAKDTERTVEGLEKDVSVLDELERYLCVDTAPQSFDDCLTNLDFVIFTMHKENSLLVERVLKQVLRGNVIMHKSEREFYYVFLVFTHGKMAVEKTKNVVSSLQGHLLNEETTRRGCIEARTRLSQMNKVAHNNEASIKREEEEIIKLLGMWTFVIEKEMSVLKAMNKMRVSHNMMVGEGWVMDRSLDRLRRICGHLSKKMGCISFQVLRAFPSNDHLYDRDSEEEEDCPVENESLTNGNNTSILDGQEVGQSPQNPDNIVDSSNLTSNVTIRENKENLNNSPSSNTSCIVPRESVNLMDEIEFKLEEPVNPPTMIIQNKFTECFQEMNDVYGIPRYKEFNPAVCHIAFFPFIFGAMFGDVFHGLILLCASIFMIKGERGFNIPVALKPIFNGRYIMFLCAAWSIFFGFLYSDFAGFYIPLLPSQYEDISLERKEDYTIPFGIDRIWHIDESQGSNFINSYKMKFSIIIGFIHMVFGCSLSIFNAIYASDMHTLYLVIIPQSLTFIMFVGYLVFLVFQKWISGHEQSIINILLEMFTHFGPMEHAPVFPYQETVQRIVFCVIISMIPFSFIAKPVFMMRFKKKNIWMHQFVECSEFVISLISNIASYLRIWAVSLAHSELTGVLKLLLKPDNYLLLPLFFIPWLLGTLIIMIGLEGLSAVLHSLRLNWIEFGSKFYKGDGYKFTPLQFMQKEEE